MVVWVLLLLALWLLLWEPRRLPDVTPKKTLLLGHRGVRGSLPENSMPAFEAAFGAGLDGLETDVQRTRDGELVLYHDFFLPDGRRLTRLSYAELRRADPNIPTLEDLSTLVRCHPGKLLNLELKTAGWRTSGLERAVAKALETCGAEGRVLVSSFNPVSLLRLRLYYPELRVALLYSEDGPRWLRSNAAAKLFARVLHMDALHPHYRLVGKDLTRWAHRRGVMLNTWTVNDPGDVKLLTLQGVNGLMADDPAALKDAYKEAMWSLNETSRTLPG